jgi:hypothetical protein
MLPPLLLTFADRHSSPSIDVEEEFVPNATWHKVAELVAPAAEPSRPQKRCLVTCHMSERAL